MLFHFSISRGAPGEESDLVLEGKTMTKVGDLTRELIDSKGAIIKDNAPLESVDHIFYDKIAENSYVYPRPYV